MVFRIGNWACVAGVIHIIPTCKKRVQSVESCVSVGVGSLHVSCSSESSLAESSTATSAAHGLLCLVWGGWVLVYNIGGVDKLDNLSASLLGSVADSLPWEFSLLLKRCLSYPFVLVWGMDVDGGWNARFWMVQRVVHALRLII